MHTARDISGAIGVGVLVITLLTLLYKHRNAGRAKWYYISAVFVLTVVEAYNTFQRSIDPDHNSSPVYIIGLDLIVFALLLLYFHKLLAVRLCRQISTGIFVLFFTQYILGAILIDDFFQQVPFITYFMGVFCLAVSIVLVLSETFNSKKNFALQNYFPFWACISTLIIFIGALPLIFARYYAGLSANLFYTTLFLVHVLGQIATIIGIFKAKTDE